MSDWIELLQPAKSYEIINDLPVFDKTVALENDGFSSELFGQLFQLEKNHFWFKYRNRLLIHVLKRYVGNFNNFLEIGCGTGFVLAALEKAFSKTIFFGSEIYLNGLQYTQSRISNAHLFQMDALDVPFEEKFAVIGAFDVIEHIENHQQVLWSIKKALKPGGYIFFTVPQHPWLWSQVDELSYHKRRYRRHELQALLSDMGFEIIYTTSFVSFLLPIMLLSRIKSNHNVKLDLLKELKISPFMNYIFAQVMSWEFAGLRAGLRYPCGGSRLVLARKAE